MLGSEELFKRLKQQVEALRIKLPEVPLGKVHMVMGYLLRGRRSSWFRPDVSVTRPNQPGDRYYEQSPMMVIEIVSEHDRQGHQAQGGQISGTRHRRSLGCLSRI